MGRRWLDASNGCVNLDGPEWKYWLPQWLRRLQRARTPPPPKTALAAGFLLTRRSRVREKRSDGATRRAQDRHRAPRHGPRRGLVRHRAQGARRRGRSRKVRPLTTRPTGARPPVHALRGRHDECVRTAPAPRARASARRRPPRAPRSLRAGQLRRLQPARRRRPRRARPRKETRRPRAGGARSADGRTTATIRSRAGTTSAPRKACAERGLGSERAHPTRPAEWFNAC